MKTILHLKKNVSKAFLLNALLVISLISTAQTLVPELVFKNPVLISGNAGSNGAKYRFSNVTTGLDAIVEIKGRSSNDVILGSIDSAGIGWDKAFQPYLGIPNVGPNREWWMEFKIEFVKEGTSNKKKITKFFVTGLDIDGDGGNLSEWAEMKKANELLLAPTTSIITSLLGTIIDLLDFNKNGKDYRVDGPTTNFTNIDTGSTAVMATYLYEKKDMMEFKIGGKTTANGGSPGNVAMRMNSLWFKQFTMAPDPILLPVELTSFSAILTADQVDLKWTTASEKNVSHFSIEKSIDGKNYSEAGIVFAYGNTSETMKYSFPDKNINTNNKGVIYYRLRSVDIDGRSELSTIRSVRTGTKGGQGMSILAYPNPVTNELRVTIPSNWQGKKVSYELYNKNGQVVVKNLEINSSQTQALNVNSLARGFYIAKVICDGEIAQQKIIKR